MKYKIVTSGDTKEVTLGEISGNLRIFSEVYAIQDVEIYLGMISHKTLVFLSVEFAHYTLQNYAKKKSQKAEICISLVRKWIEDDTSVSKEELRAAANAADAAYAAYTAASAAASAASAASAAYAAYAAYTAASAAASAAEAASAAYYAVSAASNAASAAEATAEAAGVDREKEFIRQGNFIIDFLKSGKHLFLV
jgi:hypothetical protein